MHSDTMLDGEQENRVEEQENSVSLEQSDYEASPKHTESTVADEPLSLGENSDDVCPLCGQPLVLRHSNRGLFLGCSNYPQCSYLKPVSVSHTVKTMVELSKECPWCGHNLEIKKGRFGMFVGCSNYPECQYIYKPTNTTDITCPICKKGKLTQRQGRNGKFFYGCDNYPTCKFTTPGKPVSRVCQDCGFTVMYEKKFKKGIGLVCGNTLCASRKKRKHIIIRPNS